MPGVRLLCGIVLLLAGCSGAGEHAAPSREDLPAEVGAAEFLVLHNRERAAVGTPPLAWDDALAADAAAYARELVGLGRLEHSAPASRSGQSENLWMGTHGAYGRAAMVGSWAEEKRLFRAGTFPGVSTSGRWQDVAHYTQMIWRGSARLGCAVAGDAQWDYLVCRYAPAGNVVGEAVP